MHTAHPYAILNYQTFKEHPDRIARWKFFRTREQAFAALKGQAKWGNTAARFVEVYQPGVKVAPYATPTTKQDFVEAARLWAECPRQCAGWVRRFEAARSAGYRSRKGWRPVTGGRKVYVRAVLDVAGGYGVRPQLFEAVVKVGGGWR